LVRFGKENIEADCESYELDEVEHNVHQIEEDCTEDDDILGKFWHLFQQQQEYKIGA
jgi:hypothetical protein